MASWKQRVLAELKRVKPAGVRAVLADDTKTDIAIGNGRIRWQPVIELLEDLAWTRIELVNAQGKLLAMVNVSEGGSDGELDLPKGKLSGELYSLLRLMLTAQETALRNAFEMLRPTLEVNRLMIHDLHQQGIMARRQAGLAIANANELAGRLQRAHDLKAAGDQEGFMAELTGILGAIGEAWPAIQQLGGMLGIFGGAPPAPMRTQAAKKSPPNGANGANGTVHTPPAPKPQGEIGG